MQVNRDNEIIDNPNEEIEREIERLLKESQVEEDKEIDPEAFVSDAKSDDVIADEKVQNKNIDHIAPNKQNPADHQEDVKDSKKPLPSLNELIFVRLIDPVHIPSYLVDQIKDKMFSTEKFYEFQKIACLLHTEKGIELCPTNLLYAIVHERLRQVKGFVWFVVDILTNSLILSNFSMDKEYWHKGESISILQEKAKKIVKDLKLDRIMWATKNTKFCENLGYKKAKEQIMIFEEK